MKGKSPSVLTVSAGLLRPACHVTAIGLASSNVWPGLSRATATITRLCACRADFGFDHYISDVPEDQCDLNLDKWPGSRIGLRRC